MPRAVDVRASLDFELGQVDDALAFLKRTRSELRELRMVRIWTDRLEVIDVNLDAFEILGLGYVDVEIVPVLDAVNTVYNRDSIHDFTDRPYKEFKTGRRRPWAEDRVM